jgi:hypothetical protein
MATLVETPPPPALPLVKLFPLATMGRGGAPRPDAGQLWPRGVPTELR